MDANIVMTQVTMSTLFAGALAFAKSKAWVPFFNKHSATINHVFLGVTSLGSALGIHALWNGADHSLLIVGLSPLTIAHGIWEWTKQWCLQYLVQRGAFGPVSIPGDAPAVPSTPVKAGETKD
jgi:hypothetical protein